MTSPELNKVVNCQPPCTRPGRPNGREGWRSERSPFNITPADDADFVGDVDATGLQFLHYSNGKQVAGADNGRAAGSSDLPRYSPSGVGPGSDGGNFGQAHA